MRLPRVSLPASLPLSATLATVGRVLRAGSVPLLFLGLVLGPGIDLLNQATLTSLAPVAAFAVGWIAAGFGARWEWRLVRRIGWERAARLVAGGAAAFVTVGLAAWAATRFLPGLAGAWTPVGPTVATLAAVAAVSGPGAVRRLAQIVGAPRRTARALGRAALIEGGAGTLAIALTLAAGHSRHTLAGVLAGTLLWLGRAVGAGALTALVYFALTRLGTPRIPVPFALLAALLVGAGLGWAAGLSPFIVCVGAGALIVNVGGYAERRRARAVLVAWEPTLVGVLALAAGALLALPAPVLLAAVALLATVRVAAKWGGMRAVLVSDPRPALPLNAGLALVVQGGVVLAMSLNVVLVQGGSGTFITTAVLGWVVAQVAAVPLLGLALAPPRLTQGRPVSDLSAGSPVT